jgi:enterobacteria phage integrase
MARTSKYRLPRYLERHPITDTYYYKNPSMAAKANLGKDQTVAIRLAKSLNSKYRLQIEQQAVRIEAALDFGSVPFGTAFDTFVSKYIDDYQLKSSTARRLRQRQQRLTEQLGGIQVPAITTQLLREAIASSSQFEQSKLRTLLLRFFKYAKSTGAYPAHLANPVDDLFIDPVPRQRRQRITMPQFRAIHRVAPEWMQWLMTLAFHLALRRGDLVEDFLLEDRPISSREDPRISPVEDHPVS